MFYQKLSTLFILLLFVTSCKKKKLSPDYFSTTQTIRIGMLDYGGHSVNSRFESFIAENYAYIVSREQDLDFTFYKNTNPDINIFCYWNGSLLSPEQVQLSEESAYLHNGPVNATDSLKRLGRNFDSDFYYVMDAGNVNWQNHSVNEINTLLAAGFDGVHIDNVYAHLLHETHFNEDEPYLIGTLDSNTDFTTVPAWYNAKESHDAFKDYMAFLSDNLGELVIYNGINDNYENNLPISESLHPKGYLTVCDGAVQEGFVYNGLRVKFKSNGFYGNEYWEAIVQSLMDAPLDKVHCAVSYGDVNFDRARNFSFASYLIGFNPESKSSYYYTVDDFTLTYLPEWGLNYGAPLESYDSVLEYKKKGVFMREFENALIIVNPYGSTSLEIELGEANRKLIFNKKIIVENLEGNNKVAIGKDSQLRLVKVKSVELAPYSSVILFK